MRKFWAIFLSVILVVSVMSIPAMAAEENPAGVITMQPRQSNSNKHTSSASYNGGGSNYVCLVNSSTNHFTMPFDITEPGTYNLAGLIGTARNDRGVLVLMDCGDVDVTKSANNSLFTKYTARQCNSLTDFLWNNLGNYTFDEPGRHTLTIKISAAGYNVAFSEFRLSRIGKADGYDGYTIFKNTNSSNTYERSGLGTPASNSSGLSKNGFITWAFKPDYTGTYDISPKAGCTKESSISVYRGKYSEISDDNLMAAKSVYIEGSSYGTTDYVSFGTQKMVAGQTYYFTLLATDSAGPYISGLRIAWQNAEVADDVVLTQTFDSKDYASLAHNYGVYPGDWIVWKNVIIPKDGVYTFSFNGGVQSETEQNLDLEFTVDDTSTMNITAPWTGASDSGKNTGWNTWSKTTIGSVYLTKGIHKVRMAAVGTSTASTYYFNVNMSRETGEYGSLAAPVIDVEEQVVVIDFDKELAQIDNNLAKIAVTQIGKKTVNQDPVIEFDSEDTSRILIRYAKARFVVNIEAGIEAADGSKTTSIIAKTIYVPTYMLSGVGIFPYNNKIYANLRGTTDSEATHSYFVYLAAYDENDNLLVAVGEKQTKNGELVVQPQINFTLEQMAEIEGKYAKVKFFVWEDDGLFTPMMKAYEEKAPIQ